MAYALVSITGETAALSLTQDREINDEILNDKMRTIQSIYEDRQRKIEEYAKEKVSLEGEVSLIRSTYDSCLEEEKTLDQKQATEEAGALEKGSSQQKALEQELAELEKVRKASWRFTKKALEELFSELDLIRTLPQFPDT